ncbi:hypothetical protein GCM10022215_15750 [Nocardioides fonticola]|uniref:Uncharacterized protein n=1 Tax=Nocardioides fonticola TaxID=450363 RepID=A0ABP7XIA9_9ACTN
MVKPGGTGTSRGAARSTLVAPMAPVALVARVGREVAADVVMAAP